MSDWSYLQYEERQEYLQKQKEGIVIIPPLGYFKDKNTGKVIIIEEHAEIVRKIFHLYTSGYGLKAIAQKLNEEGIPSPGYYQKQLLGNLTYQEKTPTRGVFFLVRLTGLEPAFLAKIICGS